MWMFVYSAFWKREHLFYWKYFSKEYQQRLPNEPVSRFCSKFLQEMRWIEVKYFIFTTFFAITAFLTKIYRIHFTSYKISPKNLTRELEE